MARNKGREPPVEPRPLSASSSDDEDTDVEEDEEDLRNSPSTHPPPPPRPSSFKNPKTHKTPAPVPSSTRPVSDTFAADTSKLDKKPRTKPPSTNVAVLACPSVKRPGPRTDDVFSKKAKKREKGEAQAPSSQDEGSKKVLFQRLWSEDDEIVILKGMIDYKDKKGVDPRNDADGFLEFVKKSLHVDVNKAQIVNKLRRLKKKYENAKKKNITNPHELKAFELSKKIWGVNDEKINGVSESYTEKTDFNGSVLDYEKKEVISMGLESLGRVGLSNFDEGWLLKEGMKLVGEGERAELARKWRKQSMAEMEMYLKRLDLHREMMQKTLNALGSAAH